MQGEAWVFDKRLPAIYRVLVCARLGWLCHVSGQIDFIIIPILHMRKQELSGKDEADPDLYPEPLATSPD